MIYIDTSAAMKLVRPEIHSADLSDWLRKQQGESAVVSSVLIEVELMRATRRSAPDNLNHAVKVLRGIGVVTLSPAVIRRASAYPDAGLRSLDAVHVATAEHLAEVTSEQLDAFVAYDDRLLAAARSVGLLTIAPGTT